jgi:hypothetical protein
MTYKFRIPEELGECKIVDQETCTTLGQTNEGVFKMPSYIFTMLPRSRIVGCTKEYLQAGPLDESHLLGETTIRIYADPNRVKDLCMLMRNFPVHNFYPNETFNQFNFSLCCVKDNLFYSDGVDAIFRISA